jgi:signal transduction histidine kinase
VVVHADAELVGRWDRSRLEQIVLSLLSNALKYGAGKPVEIEAHLVDDAVSLSVADHGIGIEPAALARIFDRFERAVSMRHYGGLGLGLFVAREIAAAHGGRVEARSRPGAGSTFTVTLPRIARAASGAAVGAEVGA